jgi:hypothetical protein
VKSSEVTRTATEDCKCALEEILTNSVNNVAKQLSGGENTEKKNPIAKSYI